MGEDEVDSVGPADGLDAGVPKKRINKASLLGFHFEQPGRSRHLLTWASLGHKRERWRWLRELPRKYMWAVWLGQGQWKWRKNWRDITERQREKNKSTESMYSVGKSSEDVY